MIDLNQFAENCLIFYMYYKLMKINFKGCICNFFLILMVKKS